MHIAFMIAKDKLPADMVKKEGFVILIQYVARSYKIPTPQTFINHLKDRYTTLRAARNALIRLKSLA